MDQAGTPRFDRDKFKAVVHYLCADARPDFGRVKLHKALYFADMLHMIQHGIPLTGVEYVKQQFGPTARHLRWALDELAADGAIAVMKQERFGFRSYVFSAPRSFDSNQLSSSEIELLSEVRQFVDNMSATTISELSHNAAWEAVDLGDVIPYETAYWLVPTEITPKDVDWAEKTVRDNGLAATRAL
jgi:uncharacterized phage-associated protein